MTDELLTQCFYCGRKKPAEEVMLFKNHFICKLCYSQKRYKQPIYKTSRNKKEVAIGIIFCFLGCGLFLFAIWFWFIEINKGQDSMVATAMAGGIVGVAVGLFKLGLSAFK
jgi:hypothetical protein